MSLQQKLAERVAREGPIRVALIGAGKFGSMFLSQAPHIPGLHVAAIADLSPEKARLACRNVGWDEQRLAQTRFSTDCRQACAESEVVIEATGDPIAGIEHALLAIESGKHVIMVNVEADVLAGCVLASKAESNGVVYSMAYGDQPALIAELVDWARSAGFIVAAAGKGTKYLPSYHTVTPDEVWSHYGFTPEQALAGGMNPKMFNSFLDGTKSAIEMAAVANACGLEVANDGLGFPPCGVDDLPHIMRPKALGGCLERGGIVEVVSSVERDGRPVFRDLRWGVYVVIQAPNDYTAACFKQYGLATDASGRYAAIYKPFHLIGLELSVSVLNVALRGEPTGAAREWRADVAAVAKRGLRAGEILDGEGGYTVYGRLLPVERSLAENALPIGLAHGTPLLHDIPAGSTIGYNDVVLEEGSLGVRLRRQMMGAVQVSSAA